MKVYLAWRGCTRGEPDGIDTKRCDVVDLRDNAWNIAKPIASRVLEAGRKDLVDHSLLPPGLGYVSGGARHAMRRPQVAWPHERDRGNTVQ